tara:strand:+ start:2994 stop:3893 length:900 start_codon:yes stop_codon:yes gene_type:complete
MRVLTAIGLCLLICSACTSDQQTSIRYSGILAASEFLPGNNRIPFGMVSKDGVFLEDADLMVRIAKLNGDEWQITQKAIPRWEVIEGVTPHTHPDGELHLHLDFHGIYILENVFFDTPGIWSLQFVALDGTPTEEAVFRVKEVGVAPEIGEQAIPINNLTIHNADTFEDISSRAGGNDGMHDYSVAEALRIKEPFVVFFASPEFCVTAMCGPVTDTLARAKETLKNDVIFIHIEPWNLEIARNEGRLVKSKAMELWQLPSEPWTFIVDKHGVIQSRFEGLVTVTEVLNAVVPLLEGYPN